MAETQEFFRLFMAPGVNHCGGGLGPNSSFAYTLANAPGPFDGDHDILAALDRYLITDDATLSDVSAELAELGVYGAGAAAALALSDIPFQKTIAGVRVGLVDAHVHDG